jgi:hypothetical protein
MLDSDLADLCGTTTMALNQAVTWNLDRFPDDFSFHLTKTELATLISQIVISKPGVEAAENRLVFSPNMASPCSPAS